MTREEHLAWARQRALEFVEAGDLRHAVTSMISDLAKHSETIIMGGRAADGVQLLVDRAPADEVRKWVEDFR